MSPSLKNSLRSPKLEAVHSPKVALADISIVTHGVDSLAISPPTGVSSGHPKSSDSGFMDDLDSCSQRHASPFSNSPNLNHAQGSVTPSLSHLVWSVVYRSMLCAFHPNITRCIKINPLQFDSQSDMENALRSFGDVCTYVSPPEGLISVAYYDLRDAQNAFTKFETVAPPTFITPHAMAHIGDIPLTTLSPLSSIHVIGLPINMDLVALEHVLVVFGDVWTIAVPKERDPNSETWDAWIDYFDARHAQLASNSLPNVVARMFPGKAKISVNSLLFAMPTGPNSSVLTLNTPMSIPHDQHPSETTMSSPMSPSGFLSAGLLKSISSQEHAHPTSTPPMSGFREFPTPTLPPTACFSEGWPTPPAFPAVLSGNPFYGTPISTSLPRRLISSPMPYLVRAQTPDPHGPPPPPPTGMGKRLSETFHSGPSGLRSALNFSEQFNSLAGHDDYNGNDSEYVDPSKWRRSASPAVPNRSPPRKESVSRSNLGSPMYCPGMRDSDSRGNSPAPSSNGRAGSSYAACLRSSSALPKVDLVPRENEFDIMRLLSGRDPRTTIMIRNIPNKYTQQMLIDFMNETHKGHFDFLYLRMDFKNRCNVGYAFCNMVSVSSIVSFAQRVIGNKWTRFNSDKVCMLSYANIQGKQALIDKFRNSSVMDEHPSYRPKIFHVEGPYAGEEEDFPAPSPVRSQHHRTVSTSSSPYMSSARAPPKHSHSSLPPHPVYLHSPSASPASSPSGPVHAGYTSLTRSQMRMVSLLHSNSMSMPHSPADHSNKQLSTDATPFVFDAASSIDQYFSPSSALTTAPTPPPTHSRIMTSSPAVGSPIDRPSSMAFAGISNFWTSPMAPPRMGA